MQWTTHNRISREVFDKLGVSLTREAYEGFREGIVAPDKERGQYESHHYGKSEEIEENLIKARDYFLQDDLPYAFFHLGVVLHYIQDSYTSVVSYKGCNNAVWHRKWEADIEASRFIRDLDDLERTICYSLRNKNYVRDRCLKIAKALSKKAQGRNHTVYLATLSGQKPSESCAKPIVDLNLALRASYVVTESVLSSKTCYALENKLIDNLSNHVGRMINAEKELTQRIIKLVNERDNLEKRKIQSSGIISKIKNWILGIRISRKDSAAKSANNYYSQKKHLQNVVREYRQAARGIVASYAGWYIYEIPRINPEVVSKELLTLQEVCNILGETEQTLKTALAESDVSSYYVGNSELVRRADLDRINADSLYVDSQSVEVSS